MTKNQAIDLALACLDNKCAEFFDMHRLIYTSVPELQEAMKILENLKDHPYLDVEKYYKEEKEGELLDETPNPSVPTRI